MLALTLLDFIILNIKSVDSRMSNSRKNESNIHEHNSRVKDHKPQGSDLTLKPDNLIPISVIDENPAFYQASDLIIDATQHNSAIRLIKGKFQRIRRWVSTPLIALFVLAPWLSLNDNPLLQMDLESRQLHLFGINFWPDDLLILLWVAMASAFALFAVASFAGRLWCGFTCPQTVWSMIFVWVEEHIEGSRNQRLKQKSGVSKLKSIGKSITKHSIWLALSFITGFTFVAFFETGPVLFQNLVTLNLQSDILFWLVFFTSLTYINAGWLREQVCLHMCPYSRFQSVMLDTKSLKVSYDVKRGEPRKFNSHTKETSTSENTGDCINCQLCVQVCPVGIDIRQGMQYACIDCGACIDACDDIMEKIQKPKGLIRFSNELNQHWTSLFKNRTRLLGYAVLTLVSILAFFYQVNYMESFDAHLNRDRGQLYFYSGEGNVQNAYSLKIHNKTNNNETYDLSIESFPPSSLEIASGTSVSIRQGERKVSTIILSCQAPCTLPKRSSFSLSVASTRGEMVVFESKFFNSSN